MAFKGQQKAYVIALSHSLQHELAPRGLRIQAVLLGGTSMSKSILPELRSQMDLLR